MKQRLASLGHCFWLLVVVTVDPSWRVSGFVSPTRQLLPEGRPWTMHCGGGGGGDWSSDSDSDETVDAVCASSSSSSSSSTLGRNTPRQHSASRVVPLDSASSKSLAHGRRHFMQQMGWWWWSSATTSAALVGLTATTTTLLPPAVAWARGLVQFPCVTPLANSYHFLREGTTLLEEEGTHVCA
jgi:hypothetical protein